MPVFNTSKQVEISLFKFEVGVRRNKSGQTKALRSGDFICITTNKLFCMASTTNIGQTF